MITQTGILDTLSSELFYKKRDVAFKNKSFTPSASLYLQSPSLAPPFSSVINNLHIFPIIAEVVSSTCQQENPRMVIKLEYVVFNGSSLRLQLERSRADQMEDWQNILLFFLVTTFHVIGLPTCSKLLTQRAQTSLYSERDFYSSASTARKETGSLN